MSIDSRGPRFSAWLTTAVLLAVLVAAFFSPVVAGWLALAQAAAFAIGAANARLMPYGLIFRTVVAPRLAPPTEREPVGPVRFAQAVGFVFAAAASIAFFAGVPLVGVFGATAALAAAFLNAAFGLCLACKVYPVVNLYLPVARVRRKPQGAQS